MARAPVHPDKQRDLLERMKRLGVVEEDLEERFVRASGRGGQKLHKTSSCVWLTHEPTGVQVKCEESRSQALNRFLARRRLVEKLESRRDGREEDEQIREKIRRKKARAKRRTQKKLADSKSGKDL